MKHDSTHEDLSAPGSYLLVVDCEQATDIEVGALGTLAFEAGHYAYAGSAFGPGGLSRVDRHRRIAAGDHDVRHWHIDYLLGAEETTLVGAFVTHEDAEDEVAYAIEGDPVPRFGASDSDCDSHLKRTTRNAVKDTYEGRNGELRRL